MKPRLLGSTNEFMAMRSSHDAEITHAEIALSRDSRRQTAMGHERKERLAEPATGRLPGVVKAAIQVGTEYINRWKYVVALRDRASR